MKIWNSPGPLVSTDWLADNLDQSDLIIFDVSIYITPKEPDGYEAVSGRENYLKSHIPGAQFLDLLKDLSRTDTDITLMRPTPEHIGLILQDRGVGDDCKIVIYNDGSPMWTTRAWWMIRSIGLESVSVLDGGWKKWLAESKSVDSGEVKEPAADELNIDPQPQYWVDKDEMLENIGTAAACTVNALSPKVFSGEINQYGRPGHIPGSQNMYHEYLLNRGDGTFLPPEKVREKFERIGALSDKPVIVYCGGGISATMDAFMLHQLGKTDVAVYDGSMSEWVRDTSLPLNVGEA